MLRRSAAAFAAGFVAASLLFGGAAMATGLYQRSIEVAFVPLTYLFDGTERVPPQDQQGFIYNNRTYVPLRFMSEALGKPVEYDPETYTIYVGRREALLPSLWANVENKGGGTYKLQYFEKGAQTIRGEEMERAVLISAMSALPGPGQQQASVTTQLSVSLRVPEGGGVLSGTLFVPVHYFGQPGERRVGKLTILNERNEAIYTSEELTSRSGDVPFRVAVSSGQQLRLIFTLHPGDGVAVDKSLLVTQLGVADLRTEPAAPAP